MPILITALVLTLIGCFLLFSVFRVAVLTVLHGILSVLDVFSPGVAYRIMRIGSGAWGIVKFLAALALLIVIAATFCGK